MPPIIQELSQTSSKLRHTVYAFWLWTLARMEKKLLSLISCMSWHKVTERYLVLFGVSQDTCAVWILFVYTWDMRQIFKNFMSLDVIGSTENFWSIEHIAGAIACRNILKQPAGNISREMNSVLSGLRYCKLGFFSCLSPQLLFSED